MTQIFVMRQNYLSRYAPCFGIAEYVTDVSFKKNLLD
jgi:hypothetical protein